MQIRFMFRIISWILVAVFVIVVVWQWRMLMRVRSQLAQCTAETASESTPVMSLDNNYNQELKQQSAPSPTPIAIVMRAENTCLNDPVVRTEIEKRAAELATGISENRIEEYRQEELSKRLQWRARFMDSFEEASTIAIDLFTKEKAFDEERTSQLHRIFDENIKQQREIFERLQAGRIDETTARQQGHAVREEARRQVEALLGEEQAEQLARAIGEQMRIRFERERPPRG